VQKASLAAISARSSLEVNLALNLAVTSELTPVGFLREAQCNGYSYPERSTLTSA
jgi:formate dehydrogenase assembly factor FdhD